MNNNFKYVLKASLTISNCNCIEAARSISTDSVEILIVITLQLPLVIVHYNGGSYQAYCGYKVTYSDSESTKKTKIQQKTIRNKWLYLDGSEGGKSSKLMNCNVLRANMTQMQ